MCTYFLTYLSVLPGVAGYNDPAVLRADPAGRVPPVRLPSATVAGHLAHARDQTA